MQVDGGLERLSALGFAQAPVGLALLSIGPDSFGALVASNRALAELIGRPAEELQSLDQPERLQLLGASPAAAQEQAELLRALAAGEIPDYRSELHITHSDGHRIWVEASAALVHDDNGAPAGVLLHVADVTERRLLAQALDARRAIMRSVGTLQTAEGAVAALPGPLGTAFEADFAASWMLDRAGGTVRALTTWVAPGFHGAAFARATHGLALPVGAGLPGRAWSARSCVLVPDFAGDRSLVRAEAAATDRLHGAAAVPIVVEGELLAVVELLSRDPLPESGLTCAALESVANDCAELVERVWADERRSPSGELLLVEDNEFIARLVGEMLGESYDEPLELVHVASLAEAAERFASTRPACVLLDLNLPDASGLDSVMDVRRRAPEVPIVVLTGEEDETLAVRALQEGAQDYLMKRKVDMQGLARSIRYAIERKGLEQELLSHHLRSPLTRLPTRVLFLDQLRAALSRAAAGAMAVLVVDLDRFRRVNNSLGHKAGDQVLVQAAERLLQTAGDDVEIASLGGDTFALLVQTPQAEVVAVSLAARIRAAAAEPFRVDGEEVVLAATVGIALNAVHTAGADELIGEAEIAVSRAKEAGGDRFEVYDETVRAGLRERLAIENGLRTAVAHGELRLDYQPIFSLRDRHVASVEALLRWQHPERGRIGPDEFIPIAEESGTIVPIGRWVIGEVCRRLAAWRAESGALSRVAVNVNLAVAQLHDPDLLDAVRSALAANGLGRGDLCVEVTETSLIEDLERSRETLEALRAMGVAVALDDFGTGYSSLRYVSSLPLDTIKLDRSFVTGFGRERESAIVELVGRMSQVLGVPAVAEGIEDEQHVARLLSLGYAWGQGYALGRPAPPEQLAERVRPSGTWQVPA